ncbi:MAG: CaiB/BaiF CoA transferase family protein [Pseudarthrobacter sp.]
MAGALAGIRVADFSQAWAGPFAARILAAMGAQVIKVEGPGRMDGWRGGMGVENPVRYPGTEGGARPWNRSCLFNTQNLNKVAVALDLKQKEGTELARRLAASSHLVINNFRPKVMDRLGLGYEELRTLRPDIICVDMPAFGNSGPRSHFIGWGPNFEAAAGQCAILGYEDDPTPVSTNYAFLDPTGGIHGAAAALTALFHWKRTGEGQYVEVSQHEAALPMVGEYLLDWAANQRLAVRQGNLHPWAAPHGNFRCAGDDQWVAIHVRSDSEWQSLCRVLQREDLAEDPRWNQIHVRHRHQGELRPQIEAWTRQREKHAAARELRAGGVMAGPVNDATDLLRDAHLRSRGFFQRLTHPEAGTHDYSGLPLLLSETPAEITDPAPCFGEHNREVLMGILGLSEAEYASLAAQGVIADEPSDNRRDMYSARS